MKKRVTIIGAGIAGLTTAISLKQKGYEPVIFESASEIKAIGAGLALAANAMTAYKRLGIIEDVIAIGELVTNITINDYKGKVITKMDTKNLTEKYKIQNYAVHRADLQSTLLSKINLDNLYLNKKTLAIERDGKGLLVKFEDGTEHKTDALIVAEGIHSVIRKQLLPNAMPRYSGYTCWRGVIENPNLNVENSTETWGHGKRFGMVPLTKNRIYWFACINATQNNKKFKNYTIEDLKREFQDFHAPIQTILSHTKDADLIWADILDFEPIKTFAFNNIVLIGDAAHATTPNMGQGACQAIEDAIIVAEELEKEFDISIAFKNFEKRRVKRVNAIVRKSWVLGKIAQLENKQFSKFRNFIFRILPSQLNEKQAKSLYEVDF